jgi:hypothetical protein
VLRPNPPRLVTVVLAIALIVVGMSATVFPIDIVSEMLGYVWSFIGFEIDITPEVGWVFLLLGDGLLVAGSLLPGI